MPYALLRIIVLLILAFTGTHICAQHARTAFKGVITDDKDLPIPGATIMILSAADSVLFQFATSDEKGTFGLNIPKGDFLLNINFLGMKPVYKPITAGLQQEIDLGTIKMQEATTMLSEVQVKADYIPIEIKKDTISYNADAFQTAPDAVVEDLLKKLPGVEVNPDGSLKAQGEDVKKVLVDGKEFFGDDPKAATKNLPARAIKKVKVYDKKSDIAEFTGVDDGLREKTIDLQLKEEFKKGLFGKAEAGYGTDDRYMAKANFSRFSKTVQLSFLGQYNNINQQGFSFNERSSFGGSTSGPGGEYIITSGDVPWGDGSPGQGLINTAAGGVNFNWQQSKKFNVRTSYFYNNVESTLLQNVIRQNLAEIPFDSDESLERANGSLSHRFSFNSEIKPDSLRELNINGRFSFGNNTVYSENFLQNYIPGISIESESNTTNDKRNDNLNLNSNATFVRRFGNDGRNIATTFSYNKNNVDQRNALEAITEYFNTGNTELLDQLQYSVSDNVNWSAHTNFTQPLQKRRFLEFGYMYNQVEADFDKDVSDVEGNELQFNPLLSNAYNSSFKIHRPGLTFRYAGEKDNANVGLQYQFSQVIGTDDSNPGVIEKKYKHFLPRVIWRNDIGNGKHFRFNYTTRINLPTISQLSPAIDNADPLRIYVGNPDLEAEYNHHVSVGYNSFTQFTSTSFFVSMNGGLTNDRIITSRTIDALSVETSTPINIDKEWWSSIYTSFGRPLKFIHSRFNINANVSYTKTQNVLNSALYDLNRWNQTGGISFNNLNSQVVEYNVGGQWTLSNSKYKLNPAYDQQSLTHNYYADASVTILKKWKIAGSYTYYLYTSPDLDNQSLPLLKASMSRYILPKDKGQIILSVFDALEENKGLSRNVSTNYIEEILSNSIGRYFMLTFVYNVRGAGQDPSGRMRVRGH